MHSGAGVEGKDPQLLQESVCGTDGPVWLGGADLLPECFR